MMAKRITEQASVCSEPNQKIEEKLLASQLQKKNTQIEKVSNGMISDSKPLVSPQKQISTERLPRNINKVIEPPKSLPSPTQLFQVEQIIDRKVFSGKVLYKVKWAGFPLEEATWQSIKVLSNVKQMIRAFKNRCKSSNRQEGAVRDPELKDEIMMKKSVWRGKPQLKPEWQQVLNNRGGGNTRLQLSVASNSNKNKESIASKSLNTNLKQISEIEVKKRQKMESILKMESNQQNNLCKKGVKLEQNLLVKHQQGQSRCSNEDINQFYLDNNTEQLYFQEESRGNPLKNNLMGILQGSSTATAPQTITSGGISYDLNDQLSMISRRSNATRTTVNNNGNQQLQQGVLNIADQSTTVASFTTKQSNPTEIIGRQQLDQINQVNDKQIISQQVLTNQINPNLSYRDQNVIQFVDKCNKDDDDNNNIRDRPNQQQKKKRGRKPKVKKDVISNNSEQNNHDESSVWFDQQSPSEQQLSLPKRRYNKKQKRKKQIIKELRDLQNIKSSVKQRGKKQQRYYRQVQPSQQQFISSQHSDESCTTFNQRKSNNLKPLKKQITQLKKINNLEKFNDTMVQNQTQTIGKQQYHNCIPQYQQSQQCQTNLVNRIEQWLSSKNITTAVKTQSILGKYIQQPLPNNYYQNQSNTYYNYNNNNNNNNYNNNNSFSNNNYSNNDTENRQNTQSINNNNLLGQSINYNYNQQQLFNTQSNMYSNQQFNHNSQQLAIKNTQYQSKVISIPNNCYYHGKQSLQSQQQHCNQSLQLQQQHCNQCNYFEQQKSRLQQQLYLKMSKNKQQQQQQSSEFIISEQNILNQNNNNYMPTYNPNYEQQYHQNKQALHSIIFENTIPVGNNMANESVPVMNEQVQLSQDKSKSIKQIMSGNPTKQEIPKQQLINKNGLMSNKQVKTIQLLIHSSTESKRLYLVQYIDGTLCKMDNLTIMNNHPYQVLYYLHNATRKSIK